MSVPAIGPVLLSTISDDDRTAISALLAQLGHHQPANHEAEAYYEAKQQIAHMGISVPGEVASRINAVVGWGGTVVDVIEERLDWQGWADHDEGLGLTEVFESNSLDVESGFGHLDSLLFGMSFVRVGSGASGEPSPLVTVHSPKSTTGMWNPRTRRLDVALSVTETKDNDPVEVVLDHAGVTLTAQKRRGVWQLVDRDDHGLQVPVVRIPNRPRGSRRNGRSEISKAVRYYCDAAVRTLLGMETNREFYSIPQLTLIGRGPDAFVDAEGNPTSAWRTLSGHAIAIPDDPEAEPGKERPDMGQLQVSSPQPFLDQARGWAQLLAAEVGIPSSYLGFVTDNPASADAIRAGEARLVKRVERRQTAFGRSWLEVGRLALLVRDGEAPDDYWQRVSNRWRDAATPTRAATADETTKYVSTGILPATSSVTWDRMGLSTTEQKQLRTDLAQAGPSGAEMLAAALGRQQTSTSG